MLVVLTGCGTIPNGGFYTDNPEHGTPGPVLSTITLGRGLLVQDAQLDNGRVVQAQISRDEVESYQDQTLYEQVLTIGHFSKVIGSGFSKKKDIFYRKRIWRNGRDVFYLDGAPYLVEWRLNYKHPITYIVDDMYTLDFRSFLPPKEK